MKEIIKIILTVFLFQGSILICAQEFQPPSEGKAKVYFVRTERMGWAINFKYFDGEKFIGIFNNKGYITYECDPGEHILWAVSENADYVIALLEEGKTYVVEANVKMGGMKARVELIPLSVDDEKELEAAMKIVGKKEEVTMAEEDIAERNINYADFMEIKMSEFEDLVKENHPFKRITGDNALPTKFIANKN